MKKNYLPLPIICLGMILTQLFFTLLIYRSDLRLYHNTLQILDAGYLAVPNAHILPSLKQVTTALKGAVFFTLTVGIVLPFLVYLAAWAWGRGYRRNRVFLILLSGFVIFCIMMLNRHGFNAIVTFWFLTVYITVFKLTLYSLEGVQTHLSSKHLITHLIVLALLGAVWVTVPRGTNFFLSVRDHLLLSNSFGQRITDFYYRYSPYPTYAYKPLLKKQLKTCRIEGDAAKSLLNRLEALLLRHDCLPVDSDAGADIVIHIRDDVLSFFVNGRSVLKAGMDRFLKSPSAVLQRVSSRSDRNDFARKLTAFSLAYGLPLCFYAGIFYLFKMVFNRFFRRFPVFSVSAAGCFAVGIGAMLIFRSIAPVSIPVAQLKKASASKNPDIRVAALQTISREGLDPADYMSDVFSNDRTYTPERIWWAISLAGCPQPRANETLLQLLDDPNPLVACKAYESLGKKGYRDAVGKIIEKLGTSRHWYVQGYAYQSLRSLGWKQKKSS